MASTNFYENGPNKNPYNGIDIIVKKNSTAIYSSFWNFPRISDFNYSKVNISGFHDKGLSVKLNKKVSLAVADAHICYSLYSYSAQKACKRATTSSSSTSKLLEEIKELKAKEAKEEKEEKKAEKEKKEKKEKKETKVDKKKKCSTIKSHLHSVTGLIDVKVLTELNIKISI